MGAARGSCCPLLGVVPCFDLRFLNTCLWLLHERDVSCGVNVVIASNFVRKWIMAYWILILSVWHPIRWQPKFRYNLYMLSFYNNYTLTKAILLRFHNYVAISNLRYIMCILYCGTLDLKLFEFPFIVQIFTASLKVRMFLGSSSSKQLQRRNVSYIDGLFGKTCSKTHSNFTNSCNVPGPYEMMDYEVLKIC